LVELVDDKFNVVGVIRLFIGIVIIACASCNESPTQVPTSTSVIQPTEEVMTMQVVIQVSADMARALRQRSPPPVDAKALLRTVDSFGLKLEPMHPDTDDPNLQVYFKVEVKDQAAAQQLIEQLQKLAGIEAAYVKPPDELP
jgi:hypothetical protein